MFQLSGIGSLLSAGSAGRVSNAPAGGAEAGTRRRDKDGPRFETRDRVELSRRAQRELSAKPGGDAKASADPAADLNDEEKKQVESLKRRDTEVHQHEQAHKAAAGQYAVGGPSFEYQTGPDGKRYAVGGEVQIDSSPIEGDPAATIRKMEQVRAAATAPASPSGQDQRVAASAVAETQRARAELSASDSDSDGGAAASRRLSDGPGAGRREGDADKDDRQPALDTYA